MKWLYPAVLCLLLQACGGGGSAPPEQAAAPQACSVASQRESLREHMQDRYYWYTQMRAPNEAAETLDAYFDSMLYQPIDRFSFTQSTALRNQVFIEGRRVGYGYTLVWADAARTALRVRNVEALSPVARAGLARGDTILSIDGFGPQQVADGLLPLVDTPGVPRRFLVRTVAGEHRMIDVASEDFALSPIAKTATFDITRDGAPVKVGYLAYHQFVGYSSANLNLEFYRFAAVGIGELVLDLRYNGGGSVATSRDLASMIGGARTAGRLYAYLRFNDKQAGSTQSVRFKSASTSFGLPLPEGLPRVVVITSGGTASASEMIVNGLRPFLDVVLVGDTTYGKPYGFVPRDNCGITYNAVQFESLNSQGVGGYTAGFAPTCAVPDDLDHQLGDPSEGRLRAALDYLVTGRCGVPPLALGAPKPRPAAGVFGEAVPAQMFQDE
jgi:carboxyl-terminal processing protease